MLLGLVHALLLLVIERCDVSTRGRLARTCKRLRRLFDQEATWRFLFCAHFEYQPELAAMKDLIAIREQPSGWRSCSIWRCAFREFHARTKWARDEVRRVSIYGKEVSTRWVWNKEHPEQEPPVPYTDAELNEAYAEWEARGERSPWERTDATPSKPMRHKWHEEIDDYHETIPYTDVACAEAATLRLIALICKHHPLLLGHVSEPKYYVKHWDGALTFVGIPLLHFQFEYCQPGSHMGRYHLDFHLGGRDTLLVYYFTEMHTGNMTLYSRTRTKLDNVGPQLVQIAARLQEAHVQEMLSRYYPEPSVEAGSGRRKFAAVVRIALRSRLEATLYAEALQLLSLLHLVPSGFNAEFIQALVLERSELPPSSTKRRTKNNLVAVRRAIQRVINVLMMPVLALEVKEFIGGRPAPASVHKSFMAGWPEGHLLQAKLMAPAAAKLWLLFLGKGSSADVREAFENAWLDRSAVEAMLRRFGISV